MKITSCPTCGSPAIVTNEPMQNIVDDLVRRIPFWRIVAIAFGCPGPMMRWVIRDLKESA